MMVGETGFEPAAFSSRTRRATWLRYTPMSKILLQGFLPCKPQQGSGSRALAKLGSELLDGTDLVLVQARTLAVELFEFIETGVLVK